MVSRPRGCFDRCTTRFARAQAPLQLLQEKVLLGDRGAAALPKMLGLVRALAKLPDSDVGVTAWGHLEGHADVVSRAATKMEGGAADAAKAFEEMVGGGGSKVRQPPCGVCHPASVVCTVYSVVA